MRTPKAGTGTVLTMAKSTTPELYPLTRTLARNLARKKSESAGDDRAHAIA